MCTGHDFTLSRIQLVFFLFMPQLVTHADLMSPRISIGREETATVLSLCGMVRLCRSASSSALLRPWEVGNRNDEKAVRCVGNAGEGIVPSGECSQDSKGTSRSDARCVGVSA